MLGTGLSSNVKLLVGPVHDFADYLNLHRSRKPSTPTTLLMRGKMVEAKASVAQVLETVAPNWKLQAVSRRPMNSA